MREFVIWWEPVKAPTDWCGGMPAATEAAAAAADPAAGAGAGSTAAAAPSPALSRIPSILSAIKAEDDIYDPAHGDARLLSNSLTHIWLWLWRHRPELAPIWQRAMYKNGFPIKISLNKRTITTDIKSFKRWMRSEHTAEVLAEMAPHWADLVLTGWNSTEDAAEPVPAPAAAASLLRCLRILHDVCWGRVARSELYAAWLEARTGILCVMFAFDMPMNPSCHYVLNHLGEDILTHGDVLSLLCEGLERQNQVDSGRAPSLIPHQQVQGHVKFTRSVLSLRHKVSLLAINLL